MAIIKHNHEIKLRVAAKRMFKAMVTETHKIQLPAAIKSIEILQGDGGAGTIRKTNLADGSYVKHKIEAIDTENYESKHTLVEGAMLGDKIESIHYDQKFVHLSDGECVAKIEREYRTKDDIYLSEEEIKVADDQALAFYKLTEEFLLANPNVCA